MRSDLINNSVRIDMLFEYKQCSSIDYCYIESFKV